ncbi:hypothetical protein L209DRAFT_7397 [Thermothelomyces heterothallicus CBS 203.75]
MRRTGYANRRQQGRATALRTPWCEALAAMMTASILHLVSAAPGILVQVVRWPRSVESGVRLSVRLSWLKSLTDNLNKFLHITSPGRRGPHSPTGQVTLM